MSPFSAARPQRVLEPASRFTPRQRQAGDIAANFSADFQDLLDGYKALGGALVDQGPGVLVDVAKNLPRAVWDSYARWVKAAGSGGFLEEVERHPLEFLQDVAAPLAVVFSGGASLGARFGGAAGKVGQVLAKASVAADAISIASDPIGGLAFTGIHRGLSAAWRKTMAEGGSAGSLAARGSGAAPPGTPPDFPVIETVMEEAQRRAGMLPPAAPVEAPLPGPRVLTTPKTGKELKQVLGDLVQEGRYDTAVEVSRRGKQTLRAAVADALGVPEEAISERALGETINAAEVEKAAALVRGGGGELDALHAVWAADPTDANARALLEASRGLGTNIVQYRGARGEGGRSLRQTQRTLGDVKDVERAFRRAATEDQAQDFARVWGQMRDPKNKAALAAATARPDFWAMFSEYAINWGMLSGPRTHATNLLSNSLTAIWSVPEAALGGAVGVARNLVGGRPLGVGKEFAPAWGRLIGFVEGSKQGLRLARHALETGTGVGPQKYNFSPAVPGLAGEIVRAPQRLLLTEDGFFQGLAYMQELYSQAGVAGVARGAVDEAVRGAEKTGHLILTEDFARYVTDRVKGLPADFHAQALGGAAYRTFTKELKKGGFLDSLSKATQAHPAARLIVPFVRTPWNLVEYGAARTPLALLPLFADSRKRLLGGLGRRAQNQAWAEVALGSTVAVTTAALAAEGFITGGGPSDPAQRRVLEAQGWQPYSIRLPRFLAGDPSPGDGWFSYSRLDPAGMIMGLAADAAELVPHMSEKELDQLSGLFGLAITRNLVNKTWLTGVSNLVEVVNDPERRLSQFVGNMAGLVVPNALAQVGQGLDPTLRQVEGVLDQVQKRVPGWRASLPARINLWGEEERLEAATAVNIFSPLYYRAGRGDRLAEELQRAEVYPSRPTANWGGLTLDAEQHVDYQVRAGQHSRRALQGLIGSQAWSSAPKAVRQKLAWDALNGARRLARAEMMQAYPSLVEQRQVLAVGGLRLD